METDFSDIRDNGTDDGNKGTDDGNKGKDDGNKGTDIRGGAGCAQGDGKMVKYKFNG